MPATKQLPIFLLPVLFCDVPMSDEMVMYINEILYSLPNFMAGGVLSYYTIDGILWDQSMSPCTGGRQQTPS